MGGSEPLPPIINDRNDSRGLAPMVAAGAVLSSLDVHRLIFDRVGEPRSGCVRSPGW